MLSHKRRKKHSPASRSDETAPQATDEQLLAVAADLRAWRKARKEKRA